MRVVMEAQRSLGQSPIEEIKFDARSRDDIPAVLRGLHSIYMNGATRAQVFGILEEGVHRGESQVGPSGDGSVEDLCFGGGKAGAQLRL